MARPLWQILLPIFALAFALYRGALAAAIGPRAPHGSSLFFFAFAFQAAAALVVALGIWLGRRWAAGAVVILGVAVAATAILQVYAVGATAAFAAMSEVLVAALGTGALAYVLRREFGTVHPPGESRD